MAIKITGAVLIIITSCIIGYLLSIKEDLRCRDLSEIEKILQNIFSQIDYKKEVLTVAIDNSIEDSNMYINGEFHLKIIINLQIYQKKMLLKYQH